MIIPCKQVKIYPNNKPWMTKAVKSSIQKKKQAFKQGSASDLHNANRELQIEILKAQQNFKSELQNKMATNNLCFVWSSMKTITGLRETNNSCHVTLDGFNSDVEFANALNHFFCRFDIFDFSNNISELKLELEDNKHFNIEHREVEKAFHLVKINKSHGPDNICGRLLKLCAK